MLDQLRDRLAEFLGRHTVAVLTAAEPGVSGALPVAYHADGLDVWCLLPRWAELAYLLQEQGSVQSLLIVHDGAAHAQCWLRYAGVARIAPAREWFGPLPAGILGATLGDRYHILRIVPQRLDIVDERKGWGARETLELTRLAL